MPTTFSAPPQAAAWQHHAARAGLEVVFFVMDPDGYRATGHTAAVEDGEAWSVSYEVRLDRDWRTRSAHVQGHSANGRRELLLEADGDGAWILNGAPAPELHGCHDLDLEASLLTNAFPVHRLGLEIGQEGDAPAAYVRAVGLRVARLEQTYLRNPSDDGHQRYHYTSTEFGFAAELVYDESGLVLDYPGLGVRIL